MKTLAGPFNKEGIAKSKLRSSSAHRSVASVGVIESDIKCVHSSGAGEGRDQPPGPGDKTLPLESRLRYTSGPLYSIHLYTQWRVSGKMKGSSNGGCLGYSPHHTHTATSRGGAYSPQHSSSTSGSHSTRGGQVRYSALF